AQDDVDLLLSVLHVVVLRVTRAARVDFEDVHSPRAHAELARGGAEPNAGDRVRPLINWDFGDRSRFDVANRKHPSKRGAPSATRPSVLARGAHEVSAGSGEARAHPRGSVR